MRVTEVTIKFGAPGERVLAYAALVIDDEFVVRDIKVIGRKGGGYIVAMPNRKRTDRCPYCGGKNPLGSRFCCECGARLSDARTAGLAQSDLHADVCFPVRQEPRARIEAAVVSAYEQAATAAVGAA